MAKIKIGYINILETGTVTTTNEDSSFPAYRLYDRKFARLFKGTFSVDHIIHIDQGASNNKEIDALVIPAGHNLSGATLYWEWSENDTDWTEVTHWTQADNNLIYNPAPEALTKRYWRLRMTGLSAAPELAECYMSSMYEFISHPQLGLQAGNKKNISREESVAGIPSFFERGNTRKTRKYKIIRISATERANLEAWDAEWSGLKSFFFTDPEGNQFFAELMSDLIFTDEKVDRFTVDLEIQEVLQ